LKVCALCRDEEEDRRLGVKIGTSWHLRKTMVKLRWSGDPIKTSVQFSLFIPYEIGFAQVLHITKLTWTHTKQKGTHMVTDYSALKY